MKTITSVLILTIMGLIVVDTFRPSSKSTVSLIGGVIKARHSVAVDKKYPRKDCPVCKGTGKYLSGDGIKMVDCGYCEPSATTTSISTHKPITIIKK